MAMHRFVIPAVVALVTTMAWGQHEPRISNWDAPPHWMPPIAPRLDGGPRRLNAQALGVQVGAMGLPSTQLPFIAITPCRLVDTRHAPDTQYLDNGGSGETRAYNFSTTIPYTGTGACSTLPSAAALSLNLEFRVADHSAFLTAFPDDAALPTVANVVAYNTGLFYLNSAIVPTGADGGIKVFAQWGGDVVIDVNGYYAPSSALYLPYAGTGSTAAGSDLFSITNTGAGRAMHATALGGIAVKADSDFGRGLEATAGSGIAGYFFGWHGVEAYGNGGYGGYFADKTSAATGSATLGLGNTGVSAYGNSAGGSFSSPGGHGVEAFSSASAGYFLGYHGVEAYGNAAGSSYGGYFADKTSSPTGWAKLGSATIGGHFTGTYEGIEAFAASSTAGYFDGYYGVYGYANNSAGYGVGAQNGGSGTWTDLAIGTVGVSSNGTKPFVQNHPYDRTRVVVYNALEGDEVATYTRGTARLVNGEARVPLGETFAWVTNPDLGLTVYVTPVGGWSQLYVAEKNTSSILVRSTGGAADATFDYIVTGLRIGFEQVGIVQEKNREAYIPAMVTHEQSFQRHPDMRHYTSLARFETDRAQVLGAKALGLDLTASEKLKAAIGVFAPGVTPIDRGRKPGDPQATARAVTVGPIGSLGNPPGVTPVDAGPVAGEPTVGRAVIDPATDAYGRSFHSLQRELSYSVSVDETVEPGDVLVATGDRPGIMRRAMTDGDPAVVGVVAGASGVVLGETADPAPADGSQGAGGHADLAVTGIVRCKVDASYGAIRVGDLLVTSATPGHARAAKAPAPGTVVGKALEPFEAGSGTINVLVMLR